MDEQDGRLAVIEAAIISTARPLFVGQVMVPGDGGRSNGVKLTEQGD